MTILEDIILYKKEEVATARRAIGLGDLEGQATEAGPVRPFAQALRAASKTGYGLIAEIKKASPSKGLIRPDFDPPALAQAYEKGGATCLSVLTDEPSFQGAPEYLGQARSATGLPVLRKDFIIDPYQIVQSRVLGADCILLIVACLTDPQLAELDDAARHWCMNVLVEVHNEQELERALGLSSPLIGINNRNLNTFETSLETSERLAALCPDDRLVVSESGLCAPTDLQRMSHSGIYCFLIGESLMRQEDVEAATRNLLA